jgi:hypothetical protein
MAATFSVPVLPNYLAFNWPRSCHDWQSDLLLDEGLGDAFNLLKKDKPQTVDATLGGNWSSSACVMANMYA